MAAPRNGRAHPQHLCVTCPNGYWYQLLDLCALTNTPIADPDGVYDPAEFNDRLVLGFKGDMSKAELHLIR